jgi:hypothetical protein
VVEIKVPLAQAALSPEILAQIPGLQSVVDLKAQLGQGHIPAFTPGAGKLSTFRRVKELSDDLIDD